MDTVGVIKALMQNKIFEAAGQKLVILLISKCADERQDCVRRPRCDEEGANADGGFGDADFGRLRRLVAAPQRLHVHFLSLENLFQSTRCQKFVYLQESAGHNKQLSAASLGLKPA
jgi:hypothetical protein